MPAAPSWSLPRHRDVAPSCSWPASDHPPPPVSHLQPHAPCCGRSPSLSMKHALAPHPFASQSPNFLDSASRSRRVAPRGDPAAEPTARAANQLACPHSILHAHGQERPPYQTSAKHVASGHEIVGFGNQNACARKPNCGQGKVYHKVICVPCNSCAFSTPSRLGVAPMLVLDKYESICIHICTIIFQQH